MNQPDLPTRPRAAHAPRARLLGALLLCLAGALAGPARADDSAPAPAPAAPAAAPAKPAASGDDFNFDLTPSDKPPTPSLNLQESLRIEKLAKIRRGMLTAHQTVGFVTLASLAATLVIGQLNYQDRYVTGDFTGRYKLPHLGLSIATTGLFAGTGFLALFAPNPYPKPYKLDSAMVHRVAMAAATAGMLAQIILGPIITARIGYDDQPKLALSHLVIGYASWAFMATGVVAYYF